MKIILVLPKFETHIVTPPLGLGYLAASLRKNGHNVILLDCVLKDIRLQKFKEILKKEKPDFVGVNAMTSYYNSAKKYALEAKKSGCLVCLGGPHVSALPKESLQDSGADFVLIGESDITLPSLISAIENKTSFSRIDGLAFKKGKKIIVNKKLELIKNIDDLPIPAWDLMDPRVYPIAPHGAFVKKFPVAPIITTRGCPFNCSFCASKCIWMQRLRFRNPIKVVDEIELLNKKYGVKEFHFEDDNFTANKNHAMAVCNEIIRRNLKIVWACPNGVRIDMLDEELLKIMKKSGCYLLAFGIETGSQKIADKVNKHLDLSKVPEKLRMVRNVGIETWGFFIVGLPGDTVETINQTIDFAVNNPFKRAQFCIFTPLPGSEIFSKMEHNKEYDWDNFNFFNTVYSEGISGKQIQELHKKAFRKFYLRPAIIFALVKNLKLKQIKWLFKRAIAYKFIKSG